MKLIVGLGNPEKKYQNTWHNVGFDCVDALARKLGLTQYEKSECKAVTAHTHVGRQKVILAKPLTYMNLSGESVQMLVNKYKIALEDIIVVYDDVDLPIGAVRIRQKGSAGTHNGMRNIVELLGSEDFARVRVGTHKETPMALIDFVLSQITDEDHKVLDVAINGAAEALCDFANGTALDVVMQRHNTKN